MRNFIFTLFISITIAASAEEFTVFEKDGYFGIKDEIGNVTVPAVYEKLGWSNGSTEVTNGVIGFRRDNLWGLITVRNKALTGQKFYTIQPISNGYFKASIKGRFSNHLFHGILDEKGNTVVSFNYFSIEPLGANWLVGTYNGKGQQFGVVSFENKLIVPTTYTSIESKESLFIGRQFSEKLDVYRSTGQLLQLDLDSIQLYDGYVAFRDGYAGYLSSTGKEIYPFDYKNFTFESGEIQPVRFSEWTIYQNDSVFLNWNCDSLTVSDNGMLLAYLNGSNHLLLNNNTLLNNHELVLKGVSDDQLIVQNSKTRKWAVLGENGTSVINGYDSIYAVSNHFGCYDEKGWYLVNRRGKILNRLPLQLLLPGLENQFLVKRNNHWGLLESNSKKSVTYKYDSIIATDHEYLVSYLNRWGVLDENENWLIRSEYHEVYAVGALLIGRRGLGFTIHYEGKPLYKTTYKPLYTLGKHILLDGDSSKLGLLSQEGEIIVRPQYEAINEWSTYYELKGEKYSALINENSMSILSANDQYQEIGGYGDQYFTVKKENRWGFIDGEGRLRISNRYDDARPFSEGMAPVKLRGKWGFIDKDEKIVIQPYYDEVEEFRNNRSIVQQNGKFGLLDEAGNEVLELKWTAIIRLNTGNYLVRDINGLLGLVDTNGSFIFRPFYQHFQDLGGRVLVSQNGVWGMLNYDRHPIFKINYKEIKVIGDFTMVKN